MTAQTENIVVTPQVRIHAVAEQARNDIAELIKQLRDDHIDDLDRHVGFGTMQLLESAVYKLDATVAMTAPAEQTEPAEPVQQVEWHMFELAGSRRTFVHNYGDDLSAARTEAANRNSTSFGLSYVVEPVPVEPAPAAL